MAATDYPTLRAMGQHQNLSSHQTGAMLAARAEALWELRKLAAYRVIQAKAA